MMLDETNVRDVIGISWCIYFTYFVIYREGFEGKKNIANIFGTWQIIVLHKSIDELIMYKWVSELAHHWLR